MNRHSVYYLTLFIEKFIKNPRRMGACVPSSKFLSKSIVDVVKTLTPVSIVELGAGVGAITKYLSKLEPLLVDIDKDFCKILEHKFPHLVIVNACALDHLKNIDHKIGLVISIPLINNPFKRMLTKELKDMYARGLLEWCVIYTYGLKNPLTAIGFLKEVRHKFVFYNIPPASIWVYS